MSNGEFSLVVSIYVRSTFQPTIDTLYISYKVSQPESHVTTLYTNATHMYTMPTCISVNPIPQFSLVGHV